MLYPLLLAPTYKDYLWGGRKLKTQYHKSDGPDSIAESWELSVHPDGVTRIVNGAHAGKLFTEYLDAEGPGVLGKNAGGGTLPVLVKLIDTADRLSVQVHPDDAYAQRNHGSPGKTELWYIIGCEDNAKLYFGMREVLTREEFIQRAQDGSIGDALDHVDAKPGDAFLIVPGTVHAIGKDMTVAEIGTNCNITYRIYDYGRKDAQGNPRELHIENAADVFRTGAERAEWVGGRIDCGPFRVQKLELNGGADLVAGEDSFHCLMCVEGSCALDGVRMEEGASVFVPAGMGAYRATGDATLLIVTV